MEESDQAEIIKRRAKLKEQQERNIRDAKKLIETYSDKNDKSTKALKEGQERNIKEAQKNLQLISTCSDEIIQIAAKLESASTEIRKLEQSKLQLLFEYLQKEMIENKVKVLENHINGINIILANSSYMIFKNSSIMKIIDKLPSDDLVVDPVVSPQTFNTLEEFIADEDNLPFAQQLIECVKNFKKEQKINQSPVQGLEGSKKNLNNNSI